jgi:hypothetical protein
VFGKFRYKRGRNPLELLGRAKCSDDSLQPHRTEKHLLLLIIVLLALMLLQLRFLVLPIPMMHSIPFLRTAKMLNFTTPTFPLSGAIDTCSTAMNLA